VLVADEVIEGEADGVSVAVGAATSI